MPILYAHISTVALKRKNKQNKQTGRQLKQDSYIKSLIYRVPPTVYFYRITHLFKEGRFLVETISFKSAKRIMVFCNWPFYLLMLLGENLRWSLWGLGSLDSKDISMGGGGGRED